MKETVSYITRCINHSHRFKPKFCVRSCKGIPRPTGLNWKLQAPQCSGKVSMHSSCESRFLELLSRLKELLVLVWDAYLYELPDPPAGFPTQHQLWPHREGLLQAAGLMQARCMPLLLCQFWKFEKTACLSNICMRKFLICFTSKGTQLIQLKLQRTPATPRIWTIRISLFTSKICPSGNIVLPSVSTMFSTSYVWVQMFLNSSYFYIQIKKNSIQRNILSFPPFRKDKMQYF